MKTYFNFCKHIFKDMLNNQNTYGIPKIPTYTYPENVFDKMNAK